jgi:hypothetical protein
MTESAVIRGWMEKTQLQDAREMLVLALQTRFGTVSPDVIETINGQPSRPLLLDWFRHALTAATLEEFIAVLQR